MYFKRLKFAAAAIAALTLSVQAHAGVRANIDSNGDGMLSAEEFVIFSAERDFRQRDADKNGEFSKGEWVGKGGGDFRKASFNRFDADKDEVLTASEVTDVYLWAFGNRDKNKDGQLTGDEIPQSMKKKTAKNESKAVNSAESKKKE